jgi:hypothetical protein
MSYYSYGLKNDYTTSDVYENIVSDATQIDSTQDIISGTATVDLITASNDALNAELTAIIDTLTARVLLLENVIVNLTTTA